MRTLPSTMIPIMLLLLLNPVLVLAVAQGHLVELILFAIIAYTLNDLIRHGDVRAIINLAFILAGALIIDARLIYTIIGVIFLVGVMAPPLMMRRAPYSFFLALLFPSAIILSSYLYSRIFVGHYPLGIMQVIGLSNNLNPVPMSLAAILAAFPLAVAGPALFRQERLISLPMVVTLVAPLLGSLIAQEMPLTHMPAFLALLCIPAFHAAMMLTKRGYDFIAFGLLAVGWVGGYLLTMQPFLLFLSHLHIFITGEKL